MIYPNTRASEQVHAKSSLTLTADKRASSESDTDMETAHFIGAAPHSKPMENRRRVAINHKRTCKSCLTDVCGKIRMARR